MKDKVKKIRFQGSEFYLIGETEGAIATKEQYEGGLCSFAHLTPNGEVMRFGTQIGTRNDIEFLGDAELQPSTEGVVSLIGGLLNSIEWMENEIERN